MKAVLFPGQGSQYIGMGKDFYEKYDSAKKIFKEVDETLGFSLSDIIFNGPEEKLKLTQNTQPAIMTVGVCIFNTLNEHFGLNLNSAKYFAGHSLGEYTALVCSGGLDLKSAAYLLFERGKSMQEAVPYGQGAMIAILGMSIKDIEEEISLLQQNELCEIANDNSNSQVVVSGKKTSIEILKLNLKKKKKKGIILPVSAPFHCSLMRTAAEKMKDKIVSTNFSKPKPNIISNVTAKEEDDVDKIKLLLTDQITSRVRWRESIDYMIQNGVTHFLEIGPGKVLSSLVKKVNYDVNVKNIETINNISND